MYEMDLNCDMGEGFGVYSIGYDELILPFISSANIACGFHASDPMTISKTVRLAGKHGVAVGAHPSYPDLVGFGRREINVACSEIKADVLYQVGAVMAICKSEGVKLQHVKAHGALYNRAAKDIAAACAIAEAIRALDADLTMICMSGSAMVKAAELSRLTYVEEFFADRAYTNDGRLVPRSQQGAVIHDTKLVVERVMKMATSGTVVSIEGTTIPVNAKTVCLHSDTTGSIDLARELKQRLEQEHIAIRAFGRP